MTSQHGLSIGSTSGILAVTATAIVAGSLGALAAKLYCDRSSETTGGCAAGTTAHMKRRPHHSTAAPDMISADEAASHNFERLCAYCGATELAACALKAPKPSPYDAMPRQGCVQLSAVGPLAGIGEHQVIYLAQVPLLGRLLHGLGIP